MGKMLLVGIAALCLGEFAHVSDVSSFGILLIVAAIGWGAVKMFSGSGSGSGSSSGSGGGGYQGGWAESDHTRDDYVEAIRRNDPNFHV